jgi:hypothetical protein
MARRRDRAQALRRSARALKRFVNLYRQVLAQDQDHKGVVDLVFEPPISGA